MKITKVGQDIISVNDSDVDNIATPNKIHLVHIKFSEPTISKMDWLLKTFKFTNRFIVSDSISFYNNYFKNTRHKYYVLNTVDDSIISFYKRNNKVTLNTTLLKDIDKLFIFTNIDDVLKNTEVVIAYRSDYVNNLDSFMRWDGNLIIIEEGCEY